MVFKRTSTQYATFEWRYDANKVWVQAQAHSTLVAKTLYKIIINEFGQITAAQADDTNYTLLGVADAAASSGDIVWLQIGGLVEDMITPTLSVAIGHAVKMFDGAIADVGSDYTGAASEFGTANVASSSAATLDCMLIPKIHLGTT